MKLQVQVTYAQGLVRTYLADPEMTLADFAGRVRSPGRIRSLRFGADIYDEAVVRFMANTGAATVVPFEGR